MSSRTIVRLAGEADVREVVALQRTLAQAPHWSEDVYRGYVTGEESGFRGKALFVAAAAGSILGFAAAAAVSGEAELESIAVAGPAQRAGVGSDLLHAVVAWSRSRDASALLLEVRAANLGALAFYEVQGFRREGLRRGYYKHPVDHAVLMRLNLLPGGTAERSAGCGDL